MPQLKIRSKYQVTLPVDIRSALGWSVGDKVNAHIKKDRIIVDKIINDDKDAISISIRQRFQFTLPVEIYTKFRLVEGDMLEAFVENDTLNLLPRVLLVSYYEQATSLNTQEEDNNKFRADDLSDLAKNSKRLRNKRG